MILPTVRPIFPEIDTIGAKLNHALYTGYVSNGENVRKFEKKLTEYMRTPTMAFNNGETALLTMLMAAGVGPGSRVACPSFTFHGTISAIRLLGAEPYYIDVDLEHLTIDPEAIPLGSKVHQPFSAILAVDVYGICSRYAELQRAAEYLAIPLLIDSAPAFGSMPNAFPTGGYGKAQVFSFHASKPFAIGEGGALSSKDAEFHARARAIRDFGQIPDGDEKECVSVGLNGKMLEVCGIIGVEQLRGWPQRRHTRTMLAWNYGHRLKQIEGVRVPYLDDGQWPVWTYYPVFIEPEFGRSRDEVFRFLWSRNIQARKYYTACHLLKPFFNGQRLPITEILASEVIALPLYSDMRDDEMDYIVEALSDAKREALCSSTTSGSSLTTSGTPMPA